MRDTDKALEQVDKDIEAYKTINSMLPAIKKVFQAFNGKVYNCKLERALKETFPENRLYISCRYEFIELYFLGSNNDWITITTSHKAESKYHNDNDWIKDNKRIDADKAFQDIEHYRVSRLKEITEWTEFLDHREEYTEQLEMLKKQIEYITGRIPYKMQDYFSIGYRVQRHY